jgi:uncharacterized protein (TIGR03437 family)
MKRGSRSCAIIVALLNLVVWASLAHGQERLIGVDYGPFRDGQSPDQGIFPTINQMREDMPVLRRIAPCVRTFSVTNGFDQIPGLAKQAGLKVVPTAWISRLPGASAANNAEVTQLINVANQNDNLPFLAVGSETLLRGDVSKEQLIAYINQVKQRVSLPVTTAEPWHVWRDHPDLANAVDLIFLNVYGYWENQTAENAVAYTFQRYNEIKAQYPNKRVVISETGWPTNGEVRGVAVPSLANQKRFVREFIARAAEQNADAFLFAAFDENWKRRRDYEVEAHWGFYTANRQPKHDLISLLVMTSVSAASYQRRLAPEAIATAFSDELASVTQVAVATPLPLMIAGTEVRVRDSNGVERSSPLFFVSPTQVSYQIPPNTSLGTATVTLISGTGSAENETLTLNTVAPGLFSADASGQGVAAAVALRIRADDTQTTEPVAQFDASRNQFVLRPIDLGPESEQVYLVLFGTGIRGRSALSAVITKIGGETVETLYAGLQPDFVGLDQLNARLSRNLIGRGEVDVVVTVDGVKANTVRISIK